MSEKRKDKKGRVLKDGESQRGDGRYMYRYTDIHGARRYVYAQTLDELRDKEKQIQRDIDDGIDYSADRITVVELIDKYQSTKTGLRRSTMSNYKNLRRIITSSILGPMQISSVKATDVKGFLRTLYETGHGYGSSKNVFIYLKAAFEMAVNDDILRKNPANFKLNDVIPDDTAAKDALSENDKEKLLDFTKGDIHFSRHYPAIVVLVKTGARISELCGLTLSDVDIPNRKLRINKQLSSLNKGKGYYIDRPKTKSGTRTIPIEDAELLEALKTAIKTRKPPKQEVIVDGCGGFLFLTKRGTPKTSVDFERQLNRIVEKYNSTHEDKLPKITPHTLRHTFCTEMLHEGMDCKNLQYVMGHSSAQTTLNVYSHSDFETVKAAMQKLNGTQN